MIQQQQNKFMETPDGTKKHWADCIMDAIIFFHSKSGSKELT